MKSEINVKRYIPFEMTAHIFGCNCEVFYTENEIHKKFFAVGFVGKATKYNFYYSFSTKERMLDHINTFLANNISANIEKEKRKAEQKEKAKDVTVNVGDMFHKSSGYSMTFSECYQVVAVKGKIATLKRLVGNYNDSSYGSGRVTYTKNNFMDTENEVTKRILTNYDGNPKFKFDYGYATLTNESVSHYYSWMD